MNVWKNGCLILNEELKPVTNNPVKKSMTQPTLRVAASIVFLVMSSFVHAQQRLNMEGTSIIGNKELPSVLYIVPWKSAEPVNLETPPFESVLDNVLKPIDRTTFKQQVKYYNELYPATANKP